MEARYNPSSFENTWYEFWRNRGYFHSEIIPEQRPYTIVIPPPNVTGVLHMGHGLNNTIQDILIRFHKKLGRNTCWIPGTDHAGIATQNVVEKKLLKQGSSREALGRDDFLAEVWKWKEEHGSAIIRQLQRLGAACDWQRQRFTMDDGLSAAVREVFIALFEKGLIYRGEYIINWCPRCLTALSDEEAEPTATSGQLYHIRYPLENRDPVLPGSNDYIVVATTRPETMLGDTAVAVHPDDSRYAAFHNRFIMLPLVHRRIPVICDRGVEREFGTGAVKVTPSHDPHDFAMGKTHNLQFINILHPDGRLNENAGPYNNLDRFAGRKQVVDDLTQQGLMEKIEPYQHNVGHCYRCDTVIEPYVSLQWFVRMKPLSEPAIAAVKSGAVKFYPARWANVYLNWMENIRDWCISRQIWWGHRIPVWYCDSCSHYGAFRETPRQCPKCGAAMRQDNDVLDTWFSSALWPFSTLGWPQASVEPGSAGCPLDYYYPTSVLVTDPGIIFFWVARMIMMGLEFRGNIPFHDVYIHGTVMDSQGRKMSKSLGNGIDPLEVIDTYGADALRFTIIAITPLGQNLLLAMDKFSLGQTFANKIWNASRFLHMKVMDNPACAGMITSIDQEFDLAERHPSRPGLSVIDRWLLSELDSLIDSVNNNLRNYRLNDIAMSIYSFFWHEYCDWYLEYLKISISENLALVDPRVAIKVLNSVLNLLHPIMPFLTEEIYQSFPRSHDSIMTAPMPVKTGTVITDTERRNLKHLREIINGIRNIRSVFSLTPQEPLTAFCEETPVLDRKFITGHAALIRSLTRITAIDFCASPKSISHAAVFVTANGSVAVPLRPDIEVDRELNRLVKEQDKLNQEIRKLQAKLTNENFISKAREEVILQSRESCQQFEEKVRRLTESIAMIKGINPAGPGSRDER